MNKPKSQTKKLKNKNIIPWQT